MKKDIHPKYYPKAKIICACGNVLVTGSTREEIKTELCSVCHPFYTGKQKLVDTARRVEKFQAKAKVVVASKSKKEKRASRDEARAKKEIKVKPGAEDKKVVSKKKARIAKKTAAGKK